MLVMATFEFEWYDESTDEEGVVSVRVPDYGEEYRELADIAYERAYSTVYDMLGHFAFDMVEV